jgi:hypothetical protein
LNASEGAAAALLIVLVDVYPRMETNDKAGTGFIIMALFFAVVLLVRMLFYYKQHWL